MIVDDFITQYEKQYDYYQELAERTRLILEDQFEQKGIKAIVSARAKSIESLYNKATKRNKDKQYKNIKEIYNDIIDLAGARVALYFPSNRNIVDTVIRECFNVHEIKVFPKDKQLPSHEKRFSGYWATHYRINLKSDILKEKRFTSSIVEIQVASLLMHAWSEIEHDLVYKPLSSGTSKEELAILDEVNGLVLAGEIALERLQEIKAQQTLKSSKENIDQYDLTNMLINEISKNNKKDTRIGDIKFLNDVFIKNNVFSVKDLNNMIKTIDNSNLKMSISDQLIMNILMNQYKIPKSNERQEIIEKGRSLYEQFIKYWVIIEKSVYQLSGNSKISNSIFNPDILIKQGIIDYDDYEKIKWIRSIRNNSIHGKENPAEELLVELIVEEKRIIKKIINNITDNNFKEILLNDFNCI